MLVNRVFLTDSDEEIYDSFPEIKPLGMLRFDEPLEVGLDKFDDMLAVLRDYTRKGDEKACLYYKRALSIRRAFESEYHDYAHSTSQPHSCDKLTNDTEARYKQGIALRASEWKQPSPRRAPRLRALIVKLNAKVHKQLV